MQSHVPAEGEVNLASIELVWIELQKHLNANIHPVKHEANLLRLRDLNAITDHPDVRQRTPNAMLEPLDV